jgi:hypothetical protein
MLTNLPRVVYGRLLICHTDAERKQTEHGRISIRMIYISQVPQRSCKGEREEHNERHLKKNLSHRLEFQRSVNLVSPEVVVVQSVLRIRCYGEIMVVKSGIQVER